MAEKKELTDEQKRQMELLMSEADRTPARLEQVPLPKPRPDPEDRVPDRSEESPDFTRAPVESEVSDEEFEQEMRRLAEQLGVDDEEEADEPPSFQAGGMPEKDSLDKAADDFFQDEKMQPVEQAAGGSVEKEADFVKDDDEEPADPPPGATPEEVADDIPAYLSTGEYVLPANVVRYLGLERIVTMHKGALAALQQMEDLDIIENVDENGKVEEDDDEMDYLKQPKGVVKTTLVVAKPHPSGMMALPFQEGGIANDPRYVFIPGVGYRLRSAEGLQDITQEDEDDKDKKKITEEVTDIGDKDEEDDGLTSIMEMSPTETYDYTSNVGPLGRAVTQMAGFVERGLLGGGLAAVALRGLGLPIPQYDSIADRNLDLIDSVQEFNKNATEQEKQTLRDALSRVEQTGSKDAQAASKTALGLMSQYEIDAAADVPGTDKVSQEQKEQQKASDEAGGVDTGDTSTGFSEDEDTGVGGGAELQKGGFITRRRYGGLMG